MTSPTPSDSTQRSSTLSDRYVDVAMRGAAPRERADLELELRGLIEDAIEARLDDGGVDRSAAETEALTELGDPERLADRYRGRPTHLIGPAYFFQWRGLLKVLLGVVIPIVSFLAGVGAAADDGDVGNVIGAMIEAAFMTAVQVTFWTTLVFAVIERVEPDPVVPDSEWSPDDLPEVRSGAVSLSDTAMTVVVSALTIAAMFWQRGSTLVTDGGAPVAVLDPDNWSFWWPFLIALLAVEAVFAVVVFRRGRWTPTLFGAYAAVQVVFAASTLWLLSQDRFLNPEFVALLDWGDVGDPGSILTGLIAAGVLVVTAWDLVDTGLAIRRSRRS